MKLKTYLFLKNYIKNHAFGQNGDYTLFNLFKDFADREITTVGDIITCGTSFMDFINKNKKHILKEASYVMYEELDEFEDDMIEIDYALDVLRRINRKQENDAYVGLVNYLTGKNDRVLDVGAGAIPFSSMKLASRKNNVSVMDRLLFSDNLLSKKFNLAANDEMFTKNTDVSNYDVLVGNRPCGAIGEMVESAKKENKGYIINLCHCDAKKFAKENGINADNWFEILPEIDSDVKFAEHVATNLDISSESFKVAVMKYFDFNTIPQTIADLAKLLNEGLEDLGVVTKRGNVIERRVGNTIVSYTTVKVDGKWKKVNDEFDEGEEMGEE